MGGRRWKERVRWHYWKAGLGGVTFAFGAVVVFADGLFFEKVGDEFVEGDCF